VNPALLAVLLCVGLVVGLWLLVVVVRHPAVAVGVWAAISMSNVSNVTGPIASISPYTAGVGLLVVTALVGLVRGTVRFRWTPAYLLPLVWLATRAISVPSASFPAEAWTTIVMEAKELVAFLLAILLLTSVRAIRTVIMTAVIVVALLCALTLVQEYVLHNATTFGGFANVPLGPDVGSDTSRHAGPDGDVNFWSRTILLWFPAALALLSERGTSRRQRALWMVAAALMFGGQYLTQSRGGLLSMAIGGVVWLTVSGIRPRRQVAIVVLATALVLLTPGAVTRLQTLTLGNASSIGTTDQSLTDRAAVQKVGLAMAIDHPILGVGAGGFLLAEPEYRRQTASTLSQVLAPHDVYLEMVVEGGIIGLFGFLAMVGGALAIALRIRLRWGPVAVAEGAPQEARTLASLSGGLFAGLVGWSVASIFLHLSDLPILMLFLALLAATDLHQRRAELPIVAPPPDGTRMRHTRTVAALAAATIIGVPAGWLFGADEYVTSADVVVQPSTAIPTTLYGSDVITRPSVIASAATVIISPRLLQLAASDAGLKDPEALQASASVSRVPDTQTLTIRVSSRSETVSRALLPAITKRARAYVRDENALFELSADQDPAESHSRSWTALPLLTLLISSTFVGRSGARRRVAAEPEPVLAVSA
jgi:O-antigen ligase